MLELRDVEKRLGRKLILNKISLSITNGVIGILGPNGAGKTTLIRCMTGVYDINKGNIYFDGQSIYKNKEYQKNIGYLPQTFGIFKELSVYESMELLTNLKRIPPEKAREEIEHCIARVGLEERINEKVKNLSGGMIRRLGIAQTFIGNPKVIIMDEPTSGLDPEERIRFKNIISSVERTHIVILSTHIVSDIESLCKKLIVMSKGKVIFYDTTDELKKLANNKVYYIQESLQPQISEPYIVQQRFESNGEKMLRFISSVKQEKAVSIVPSTEDGYICSLKNI